MERRSDTIHEAGYVRIDAGRAMLEGNLILPEGARGVVLFAHGSGSSRYSPRNRYVAKVLQRAGLGTLLIDLLTPREEQIDNSTMQLRFDIGLLADRLRGVTDWLRQNDTTRPLRIGYFGASTGAAAALVAAAGLGDEISSVVSRGGRPDMASQYLPRVTTPTLLIVGQDDTQVMILNRQALDHLGSQVKKLVIIPGATHLFEEPDALEQVAQYATEWFSQYLIDRFPEHFIA